MAQSLRRIYRAEVFSAKGKRVGRVVDALFDFEKPIVVGYLVQRPRLLMLLDRADRCLALDRTVIDSEGVRVTEERAAWDKKAAARLGLDWEQTVAWSGMPVRTAGGTELGKVRDGLYDPVTGKLEALGLSGGATADLAVGVRDLPARWVTGYRDGSIVVDDQAAALETSGGVATAAGKQAAVAMAQASETTKAASKAAKTAAAYGASAAKVAAQSETGKKALSWFKSVRDEIVDAMGDPEDDD